MNVNMKGTTAKIVWSVVGVCVVIAIYSWAFLQFMFVVMFLISLFLVVTGN